MMTRGAYIFIFLFVMCQDIWAQQDSIAIKEVTVSDSQLRQFSDSQTVLRLNDSIMEKNQKSLTGLLNYNSPIYFKENGLGMVSSPSFRGTTAQQTAVIWNGININSQLNGQTDFNTVSTQNFENVSVRSGGGSVIYGSSAIGGSIHLNNDLAFGPVFRNAFDLGYGSFETYQAHYKITASNEKVSVNAGISRNSSQNDYDYIDSKKDLKNENGQFYNTSMNVAFGYKINHSNYLKLYNQVFESERHFSLVNPSDTQTKYRDFNTRNLLEWSSFFNRFTSKVKVAFLSEEYKYFENIQSDDFYFGKVETLIAKYDLAYDISPDIRTNLIVDFTQHKGNGSDIEPQKRQIGSAALLWKHRFDKVFVYELSVRKETTSNYDSPLLFSIGTHLSPSEQYSLKMNFSKNFRIPTFNDLYWKVGGNPDLKPETSRQLEIGNEFKTKHFRLTASVYQMQIQDMIRWVPGNGGVFSPENTNKVLVNGAEAAVQYERRFGRHHLNAGGTYGYTDSRNTENGKQLIYVPFHKATASLGYGFRKLSFAYQHLYNGFVYTQSDNNPKKKVGDYHVSNAMVFYDFGKRETVQIGFKVLNIWNQIYESVDDRPLPGRHFNATLTFKF